MLNTTFCKDWIKREANVAYLRSMADAIRVPRRHHKAKQTAELLTEFIVLMDDTFCQNIRQKYKDAIIEIMTHPIYNSAPYRVTTPIDYNSVFSYRLCFTMLCEIGLVDNGNMLNARGRYRSSSYKMTEIIYDCEYSNDFRFPIYDISTDKLQSLLQQLDSCAPFIKSMFNNLEMEELIKQIAPIRNEYMRIKLAVEYINKNYHPSMLDAYQAGTPAEDIFA